MDVGSPIGTSVSEDVNVFHELSVDPPESTCRVAEDLSVNDLGNGLTEFLNIQDDQKLVSGSFLPSGKNGVEKEDTCEESHQSKLTTSTSEKCLSKSATFPFSSKITSSIPSEDGEDHIITEVLVPNGYAKSVTPPCQHSKSLPTPLKIVSAMKGSREKQGIIPPKELSVTWDPDVYDPTPTAVSHVVTNKSRKHRSEGRKNARSKQKGSSKPSRGNRGKDKKQTRKYGGGTSSNRGFKSLDDDNDSVVDCDERRTSLMDFNVGSPDPYCGSSFLKNSVTKLHFSVAEAT